MRIKGLIVGFLMAGFTASGDISAGDYLLIDDFSDSLSSLGTTWEGFTDRVMGGKSDMSVGVIPDSENPYLRMQGTVSLANNGGFIQVRLMLSKSRQTFDGSGYKGVRIKARGKGSSYYLHLRTAGTVLPWKYYSAPLPLAENWVEIDIPWSTFSGGDYGRLPPLKTNKLKSIAIVAAKAEFDADIEVTEIGFY